MKKIYETIPRLAKIGQLLFLLTIIVFFFMLAGGGLFTSFYAIFGVIIGSVISSILCLISFLQDKSNKVPLFLIAIDLVIAFVLFLLLLSLLLNPD